MARCACSREPSARMAAGGRVWVLRPRQDGAPLTGGTGWKSVPNHCAARAQNGTVPLQRPSDSESQWAGLDETWRSGGRQVGQSPVMGFLHLQGLGICNRPRLERLELPAAQRMVGVAEGGWGIDRCDDNRKVDIFLPGMSEWHGTVVSESRLARYWTRCSMSCSDENETHGEEGSKRMQRDK
jgi:hypothetical protein